MPAPSTCTVSGTVYGPNGSAISGAKVKIMATTAFVDASGNYVAEGVIASTTTSASGTWSLACVRTYTLNRSITFVFEYPLGNNQSRTVTYAAVIPDQATANFSDLVDLTTGSSITTGIATTDSLTEGSTNLYGSSLIKSNAVALSNGASSSTVTFTTAWAANTNYDLFFNMKNIEDGTYVASSFLVSSQSVSGFTVLYPPVDSANYVLHWAAIKRHDP